MKIILRYLHTFLFAISVPVYVYTSQPHIYIHAKPDSIWRFVFVFLGCAVFLNIAFFALLREHIAAGLVSSCLLLGLIYPRDLFFLIISIIILTSTLLAFFKKRIDLIDPFRVATVISIVIALYAGLQYIFLSQTFETYKEPSMADYVGIKPSALEPSSKPDIYYIILDAYGGEAMLKELHAFDNSMFTSALRERGFILSPTSKSNYLRTIHSLSSSLNMQYLDPVSQAMGDSPLWWPLEGSFANNETRRFLESQGYKTVLVASGWDLTTIKDVDEFRQPYPIFLNEFEGFFIEYTNLSLFGFMEDLGVSFPSYDTHRRTVLYELEQLKNIPKLDSPKFTFVHIVSPHPPFVFDPRGNPRNPDYRFTIADNRYLILPPSRYEKSYLDQILFVNAQILEVVDAILEKSPSPPIIIIQGDHGPGIFIDSQTSSPPCFYERYSILNAYYLPGMDPKDVPQDITPVNTFRMIFNHYFSADLEFLSNHQYFSSPEAIHQFEDVTDRTDDSCMFPK
jgi:hypothetical protein